MGTGGNSTGPTLSAGLAESTLSAGIALPNEGPELNDPAVDESITLMEPAAASDAPTPIEPGQVITVEIPFEAPEGNVVAAGIRFGDEGPIRQVEIPEAEGDTSNTLRFQFEVPPDICDDLADICHDIVCYEFAVTDIGEISAANIMQLGLVCGDGCNEPTCQELLMCEAPAEPDAGDGTTEPDPPVADGTCRSNADCGPRFQSNYLTLACIAGVCSDCTGDADCDPGSSCAGGGCAVEYCDAYPIVPADMIGADCECPDPQDTDCTDSPDCPGRCYGLYCFQECNGQVGADYCFNICEAPQSCFSGYCN
jgi:hypothetical protein